jgi:hypothetical protein
MSEESNTSFDACPFITEVDADTYLVIGATTTPQRAAEHGGGVAEHETAVLVPKGIIDALSQPLWQRVHDLESDRDKIWLLIARLREQAKAVGLDPYSDPVAQELSAILCRVGTGDE